MKINYKFFYDRANNNYRCTQISEEGFKNIRIESVSSLLRNTLFEYASIQNNELYLSNQEMIVQIEDVSKCPILFDLLHKNYFLLKKAIIKSGKNQTTSKFPFNIIRNQKLVTGGLIILTIAGIKLFSLEKDAVVEAAPCIIEVMDIKEEQTIEKTNNIEIKSNIKRTPVKVIGLESNGIDPLVPEKNVEINHATALDTPTYKGAKEKYYDLVSKCSNRWGLDPELVMAMLTQESAGLRSNLLQFTFTAFEGGKITQYDFENNRYQTYFFTDDPQYTSNNKYTVIRSTDLNDAETNLNVACANLQSLIQTYHNPFVGIMTYNQGPGNMDKIFAETYLKTGETKEEITSSYTNIDFYINAYASHAGDKSYLENVLRYLSKHSITFKYYENGEIEEVTITLTSPKELEKTYK